MLSTNTSLRAIKGLKPVYFVPKDNVVQEAMIPCMSSATSYDCMVGYFQSRSLREIAPGLAVFLSKPHTKMKLIISPHLHPKDKDAIEKGVNNKDDLAFWEQQIREIIGSSSIDRNALERHTLECLAYLIGNERLEIKIAVMKAGIFHPKVHLFRDDANDEVCIHGSANLTLPGLNDNFEHLTIEKSWQEPEKVHQFSSIFDETWNSYGNNDYKVYNLPQALKEKIVMEWYPSDKPTQHAFFEALNDSNDETKSNIPSWKPERLVVPSNRECWSGDFAHQGEAITKWEEADRKGILQMATGSGKTISALVAATRLQDESESLLIVVSVPSRPLVSQWEEEIKEFGVSPFVARQPRAKNLASIESAIEELKLGISPVKVLILTNYALKDEEYQKLISSYKGQSLLIADEMHELGTEAFYKNPPEFFICRLGLSATPVRQYDEEGTEELITYFGEVVYEFSLEDAIGKCLVPYDYFVHKVELTEDEFIEFIEISTKLSKFGWAIAAAHASKKETPAKVQSLLRERRSLLEQAANKKSVLETLLKNYGPGKIKHTLIYTSDKNAQQLEDVNKILLDLDVLFHQLTYKETGKWKLSSEIIDQFTRGNYQALTAERVLDQGVDIPQIATAYILASTTVERQWVQRRGRVLRKCNDTNKKFATIHDFVVLPPSDMIKGSLDKNVLRFIEAEIKRIREFANTSRNKLSADGGSIVANKIVMDYFVDLDSQQYKSNQYQINEQE